LVVPSAQQPVEWRESSVWILDLWERVAVLALMERVQPVLQERLA
jgi:hypothetical protein